MTDSAQKPDKDEAASVSSSLLVRLCGRDAEAWKRLVRLYFPMVVSWGKRRGLQEEDAADVAQEVFRTLAVNIGRFQRDGGRNSFAAWLWGITRNHLLAHRRRRSPAAAEGGTTAQKRLADVLEPGFDGPSAAEAADERTGLVRRALQLLRSGVEEKTFQAFWRATVEGHAAEDIAAELGMSVNAVYLAKARLLRRLREEFGDLLG